MHTYIQVFKNKSKHTRLYLILFFGLILIGLIGIVMTYVFKTSFIPFLNEAAYFVLFFNGIITCWIIWDSAKKAKYFVEWNNSEINYLLPKSDKTESIKFENIKSIDVNPSDVIITLNNSEIKHFDLSLFFFPERQVIIDFFEENKGKLTKTV